MAEFRYLKNVATLKLNEKKCIGCGMCVKVCPHRIFVLKNKKALITDKDKCMECGACALNCAYKAITVNSGVGCAYAVINGWMKGTDPDCDCGSGCCD